VAKKLVLRGRVQGVFCRNYCRQYALKMGLGGSATNLRDGTVRVILDTDDELIVREYVASLKNNPSGFTFFGSITGVDVSDYSGRSGGDYNF